MLALSLQLLLRLSLVKQVVFRMTLIMFNTVIYLIASPGQMQLETIPPEGMEKMKMPLSEKHDKNHKTDYFGI